MGYIIVSAICIIIVCVLTYKLTSQAAALRATNILLQEAQNNLHDTNAAVIDAEHTLAASKQANEYEQQQLRAAKVELQETRDAYDELIEKKRQLVDVDIEHERAKKQQELDKTFAEKQQMYQVLLANIEQQCKEDEELAKESTAQLIKELQEKTQQYIDAEAMERERFESLRRPLLQYEMDKQARLFYTIQIPEELREDVDYLLTVTAAKIRHPDIIGKLIWTTYVKPYMDDLCKRTDIKDEAGIYKITHIDSGKSYIGKSTNVKKRLQDHMKSVVGLTTIADQAVHHEILKTGFWNWTFEIIIYCDKDKLSELEKYYIDFFKTQEYGFNKNSGG